MGLFDRKRLPAEVLASLAAHLAESGGQAPRVLAWTPSADGVLVGLPDRLALLDGGRWESLPWHRVLSATWSDDGTSLVWRTVDRPHTDRMVEVREPGRLPDLVHERVEQTFVLRRTVSLVPGALATLTGRRPADGDGEIEWSVVAPKGVNLRRPELADAVAATIERAKRDWA